MIQKLSPTHRTVGTTLLFLVFMNTWRIDASLAIELGWLINTRIFHVLTRVFQVYVIQNTLLNYMLLFFKFS